MQEKGFSGFVWHVMAVHSIFLLGDEKFTTKTVFASYYLILCLPTFLNICLRFSISA